MIKRLPVFSVHAALALAVILSLTAAPVEAAKGGPGKVTVTAAEPAQAEQGQELDVYISGDGFDEGSTATFYVSGTNDDSQIIVDSTVYEEATGRLKSHIRVNGSASVADYDIEVKNSGGRRGKGTTLFKVQKAAIACTGEEPKEPEIAYLTALTTDGEYETQDLYLSSTSGCDQYLLLQDAAVKVPGDVVNNVQQPGDYLVGVRGLRLDVQGDNGVAIWRDEEVEIDRLYVLGFNISASGAVTPDAAGSDVIYVSPAGSYVTQADVRFNSDDQLELLILENVQIDGVNADRHVVHSNVETLESTLLMSGNCPAQDASGFCYRPDPGFRPWWNEDGTQVFLNLYAPDTGDTAIGRLSRVGGVWQPAEVLMTHESQVTILGVRSDGLLAYEWLNYVSRKKGRTNFQETEWFVGYIEPDGCDAVECSPSSGDVLPVESSKFPRGWTREGGLLFRESGPGAQLNIRIYSDPFTGTVGTLEISDVDGAEWDTTY